MLALAPQTKSSAAAWGLAAIEALEMPPSSVRKTCTPTELLAQPRAPTLPPPAGTARSSSSSGGSAGSSGVRAGPQVNVLVAIQLPLLPPPP
eukprot:COSAG04_NODE_14400_length_569_cov_1.472340_2_plen_91_part_01